MDPEVITNDNANVQDVDDPAKNGVNISAKSGEKTDTNGGGSNGVRPKSPMDLLFDRYKTNQPENGADDNNKPDDNSQDTLPPSDDGSGSDNEAGVAPAEPKVETPKEESFESVIKSLEESVGKDIKIDSNTVTQVKQLVAKAEELNSLKADYEKLKSHVSENTTEEKEFINAFKKDPKKAIADYAESLKLPDPQVITTMLSNLAYYPDESYIVRYERKTVEKGSFPIGSVFR